MGQVEDRAKAVIEFTRLVQPSVLPTLTTQEIDDIIDRHLRAIAWAAATALTFDTMIQASNGRLFRVVTPGTTGDTEPIWPSRRFWGDETRTRRVTDGTVIFEYVGEQLGNVYDIRAAVAEGWDTKLAKAVEYVSSSEARDVQIYEHCEKMANRYRYIGVGI